jgi:hypothetical protein
MPTNDLTYPLKDRNSILDKKETILKCMLFKRINFSNFSPALIFGGGNGTAV